MKTLSLGDRMKEYYERAPAIQLPRRLPVILRLDGRAFHTFTRKFKKPFDDSLIKFMNDTTMHLLGEAQGSIVAYVQSDEISIFLHSYKRHDTAAWFDNKVQKMVSVSAGTASSFFSREYYRLYPDSKALPVFDARVFVVPEDDVNNYFLWRQQDWVRNSVQMVASSIYSHSQLHKKNQKDMKEMILAAGQDWEALSPELRIGRTFARTENGFELISGHDFKANPDLIREALKQDESQD